MISPAEIAHHVLRSSLCGVYVHDINRSHAEYVNAEFTRLTGWTLSELAAFEHDEFLSLVHPADRERFLTHTAALAHLAPHETLDVEYRMRGKSGQWIECLAREGTVPPATEGQPTRIVATLLDNSHRGHAHGRACSMIDAAPTAMVLLDCGGLISCVNAEFERQFGYPGEQLENAAITNLLPNYRLGLGRHPSEKIQKPGSSRGGDTAIETTGCRCDGTIFPVQLRTSTVTIEQATFTLCSVVDISTQKQLQADQDRLHSQLQASNRALEGSNIELKQFAHVASHDLKAPLRSMKTFANFLCAEYSDQLDELGKSHVDRIVNGASRMQRMIDDLLDYSRVESRSAPFISTDLNPVIEDAIEMLRSSIEDTGANIQVSPLPVVYCDPRQIVHLFQNLIGNAIKYSGPRALVVDVFAEKLGEQWQFAIRDNGIGIPRNQHGRIFELFRRLHSPSEFPGTGMGLAICRKIVDRHGGRIWVESIEDEGSTFYFTLPVHEQK